MNKRTLQLSSPEYTDYNSNKKFMSQKMANQNSTGDVFSWEMMRGILDEKLHDVAKKEDLQSIRNDIEELKEENQQLKNEIKKLTSRIEFIDRRSRSTNLVVNGLKCSNVQSAKVEFIKICTNVLDVKINVISTRMIAKEKTFLFNLESSSEVQKVLSTKGKLKDHTVYIQKDYTEEEQQVRYNLRQVSKRINEKKKGLKVRLGEFWIFVENKKYAWSKGKIMAYTNDDAVFLNNLLMECGCSFEICVREMHQDIPQSQ